MRVQRMLGMVVVSAATMAGSSRAARGQSHMDPIVDLLAQNKPVFGVYRPSNPRAGRGGRAGDAPPPAPVAKKSESELAADALAYKTADYVFDGSMEGDFDAAFPVFKDFMAGLRAAGPAVDPSTHRMHHPVFIKTHLIAENPTLAAGRIGKQLNTGVAGIVFVGVESADEVKTGLAAMRFKSNGGTRPDDIGDAAKFWGVSEKEYRDRADLAPLNPKGELTNWTIVESIEGLKHVREIAAVKGISVLFPGAGTLGGVFSKTDASGKRVRDDVAWEASIQQVLAACKEFHVPCGFPANSPEVLDLRMKQGFSVFVINWGDQGFKTVDFGLQASGRK